MWIGVIVGEVTLGLLSILAWGIALWLNRTILPTSKNAVKLPKLIAKLLGSISPDNVVDLRGLLLQLLVLLMTPITALFIAKIISFDHFLIWFRITTIGLLIVVIVDLMRNWRCYR